MKRREFLKRSVVSTLLNAIYWNILNLEDTLKHTAPSRLRDREA